MAFKLTLPGSKSKEQAKQPAAKPKAAPGPDRNEKGMDLGVFQKIMPMLEFAMPLIRHYSVNTRLKILGVAALLYFLAVAATVFINNLEAAHSARYTAETGDLQVALHKITRDVQVGLSGNVKGFDGLQRSANEFNRFITLLDKGDASLPPTSGDARDALNSLMGVSNGMMSNVEKTLKGRQDLQILGNVIAAIDKTSKDFRVVTQQMIDNYQGDQRVAAAQLALAVERIAKDTNQMLISDITLEQLAQLGIDTFAAEDALKLLPAYDPLVQEAVKLFDPYRISIETLVERARDLVETNAAARLVLRDAIPVLEKAEKLVEAYQNPLIVRITGILAPILALLLLWDILLLIKQFADESVRRGREAERVNRENQAAILTLMNEMGNFADGDLSVRATVNESITGAIADSMNYTAEELRKLVGRIISAAEQLGRGTKDAGDISKGLQAASQKQAQEIRGAESSVQLMTKSIQEVDASAAQSATVARRTLIVTEQGAQAVRNTIAGMDGIREQIQDTSKRIKRLGESSQEIGEIVDLISDITEQTNVLALNAAIQAASAGEAGRGFSVVAEEVQRLAERSADATRQIGALVKTIQSDTQDAVAAMEKSTMGVVEGAKLSDVAGRSLQEIEQVSNELATLINSISVSTQVQTDMAAEVASSMKDILRITEQTTDGSRLTSNSIEQLNKLAIDLRGSVSGFKL